MADPVRIALLGRAGDAREHLRRALSDLGADIAVEGDPTDLEPSAVMAATPAVVIVSLDGGIEEQLDRWDPLFDHPSVNVIFDEAEVTRQLAGWDLARWARHLACKVLQTGDALPPAPPDAVPLPDADMPLEPGAPPSPAALEDHARIEDYIEEAPAHAQDVPIQPDPAQDRPREPEIAPEVGGDTAPNLGGLDVEQIEAAMVQDVPALPVAQDDAVPQDTPQEDADLAALMAQFSEDASLVVVADDPGQAIPDVPVIDPGLATFDETARLVSVALEGEDAPERIELDGELAALAEGIDFDAGLVVAEPEPEPEAARADDIPTDDLAAAPRPGPTDAPAAGMADPAPVGNDAIEPDAPSPKRGLGALSLEPMAEEGEAPPSSAVAPPKPVPAPAVSFDFDSLAAGFGLVPMEEEAPAGGSTDAGLVLLLAGLGGPDAVRQFLAGLPEFMPVPVVVRQHLDAGNHDRLLVQLARATRIPTVLAIAGQRLMANHVYVLPNRVGIVPREPVGFSFAAIEDESVGLVAPLAAARADLSAFVLSGASERDAQALAALASSGAQILAQDPEACFDAAGPRAIVNAGLPVADPAGLAARARKRWIEE